MKVHNTRCCCKQEKLSETRNASKREYQIVRHSEILKSVTAPKSHRFFDCTLFYARRTKRESYEGIKKNDIRKIAPRRSRRACARTPLSLFLSRTVLLVSTLSALRPRGERVY